jgi:hypothetical protein
MPRYGTFCELTRRLLLFVDLTLPNVSKSEKAIRPRPISHEYDHITATRPRTLSKDVEREMARHLLYSSARASCSFQWGINESQHWTVPDAGEMRS